MHYRTTGPEIWQQTRGRITHFVVAAGTGGTVSGAAKYLKEMNPKIRIVSGDPEGSVYAGFAQTGEVGGGAPYKVEGIGGDAVPANVWFQYIDEFRGERPHRLPHDSAARARRASSSTLVRRERGTGFRRRARGG